MTQTCVASLLSLLYSQCIVIAYLCVYLISYGMDVKSMHCNFWDWDSRSLTYGTKVPV